jgi:thioesterase domain-containing protein
MGGAPVYILGHSLGAVRAWQAAWSRVKRGLPVAGVFALAPPNAGDSSIRRTMEAHQAINGLVARSLLNGRDIVPDVPPDMRLFGEEYVQAWDLTEIWQPPAAGAPPSLDPWHAIALYQAGATSLPPVGGALELAAAADLIAQLYKQADGWDWAHELNGEYCVGHIASSGARCAIYRGSITELDWRLDFDFSKTTVMGAGLPAGFWRGVAASEAAGLDAFLSG